MPPESLPHHRRSDCRACGSTDLRAFLSLGPSPLANAFLDLPSQFGEERRYPLDVYFCMHCSLVQLLDVITPQVLFHNYVYVKGTSDTLSAHNVAYARTIVDQLALKPSDLVIEVGSNDGSLLKCFQQLGVRTLGIDPAANIAEMARRDGVDTLDQFFSHDVSREVRQQYGAARVVIGNNVLAHVDDTPDFLRGCRELLTTDGFLVIEVPYLGDLLAHLEYDTVYHEHLCYFSVGSLLRLFGDAGLSIVRIDRLTLHGGSLRIYAQSTQSAGGHAASILAWSQQEVQEGMSELTRYERFAADVAKSRTTLLELLEDLRQQGRSVVGYGAPAKASTLLNYCEIGAEQIEYTVDKNELKIGRYVPGAHLPVLPVNTLLERQPDYVLLLAWNFADEIMQQQQVYQQRGGRFISPIPRARVV
jgi:SAM-dependent methyltransferase